MRIPAPATLVLLLTTALVASCSSSEPGAGPSAGPAVSSAASGSGPGVGTTGPPSDGTDPVTTGAPDTSQSEPSSAADPSASAAPDVGLFTAAAAGLALTAQIGTSAVYETDIVLAQADKFAPTSAVAVGPNVWIRAAASADADCAASRSCTYRDSILVFDAADGTLLRTIELGDEYSVGFTLLSTLRVGPDGVWGVGFWRLPDRTLEQRIFAVDPTSFDWVLEPVAPTLPQTASTNPTEIDSLFVVDDQVVVTTSRPLEDGSRVVDLHTLDPTSGDLTAVAELVAPTGAPGYDSYTVNTALVRGTVVEYRINTFWITYDTVSSKVTKTEGTKDFPHAALPDGGLLARTSAGLSLRDAANTETSAVPIAFTQYAGEKNIVFSLDVRDGLVAAAATTDGIALYDVAAGELAVLTTSSQTGSTEMRYHDPTVVITETGLWLATDNRIYVLEPIGASSRPVLMEVTTLDAS